MKKHLQLAAIACMAMAFAHGAHAKVNCGTLTTKDAKHLEDLSSLLERRAKGALTLLTVEVASLPPNQSRVFFSLDGENAISVLQHGSSMQAHARNIQKAVDIRDKATDPATKKQLEEFLNDAVMTLRTRADFVANSVEKLRKHATPYWWNPNMEDVDKASKAVKHFLQDCTF